MAKYYLLYSAKYLGTVLGWHKVFIFPRKIRLHFLHSLLSNCFYFHHGDTCRVYCNARLFFKLLLLARCHKHINYIFRCGMDSELYFWYLLCKWDFYRSFYYMSLKGFKNRCQSSLTGKDNQTHSIIMNF